MASSNDDNSKSFLGKQDSFYESSNKRDSLFETKTNSLAASRKKNSIIEKESTSFNLEDSLLSNNRSYSTTLNTQVEVKSPPPTTSFKEESFLIRKDQTPGTWFSFYLMAFIMKLDNNILAILGLIEI